MITATVLANGDLKVTADNETRAFIAQSVREDRSYWAIMGELFESYFCNGRYEPFDAGDGNPFVGLTSAPCIAESIVYQDDGIKAIDGRFWYHADYMLTDDLAELARYGRYVYTLAA